MMTDIIGAAMILLLSLLLICIVFIMAYIFVWLSDKSCEKKRRKINDR